MRNKGHDIPGCIGDPISVPVSKASFQTQSVSKTPLRTAIDAHFPGKCPSLFPQPRVTYYEPDYPYTILFEPNFGVHIPRSFGKTVIVFTSHLDLTWDKGVELRFFQVGRPPSHRVWEAYQPHITDAYSLDFTDCPRVADVYVKWLTWLDDWEMHRDDPVPWRNQPVPTLEAGFGKTRAAIA
ncbi:uncharacterized protein TNCV_1560011 [Trichonephila clavipes]|nr:uncharacterized protein TNCV_1560011 [Trichonephila clavipes]